MAYITTRDFGHRYGSTFKILDTDCSVSNATNLVCKKGLNTVNARLTTYSTKDMFTKFNSTYYAITASSNDNLQLKVKKNGTQYYFYKTYSVMKTLEIYWAALVMNCSRAWSTDNYAETAALDEFNGYRFLPTSGIQILVYNCGINTEKYGCSGKGQTMSYSIKKVQFYYRGALVFSNTNYAPYAGQCRVVTNWNDNDKYACIGNNGYFDLITPDTHLLGSSKYSIQLLVQNSYNQPADYTDSTSQKSLGVSSQDSAYEYLSKNLSATDEKTYVSIDFNTYNGSSLHKAINVQIPVRMTTFTWTSIYKSIANGSTNIAGVKNLDWSLLSTTRAKTSM